MGAAHSYEVGRAFWEQTAKRYDLSMWLLGGPLAPTRERVVDEVRGRSRVLELAAGTGLVTQAMAPVVGELVATDYAEAMVARLAARVGALDNVQTRVLDVYDLDDEARYDALVACNVLHLLPDLDGALDRMARALVPGGRLVVPTYCHAQTATARRVSWALGLIGFPGQRRLSLEGLTRAVVSRGLRLRRSEIVPGLLPIGFVSAEVAP